MKKIVFLNSTLDIGGAERMHYEIIRHLDNTRFRIKACCLYKPGSFGERLLSEGIDLQHSFMRHKYDLIGLYKLFSILKKEKADIAYIENSPLTLFWGFLCARILRIGFVATIIHFMRKPGWWVRFKSGFVNRLILHMLDRVGVVSEAKMDSLIKEYGLKREKLMLIHNAIDIDRFSNLGDRDGLRQKIGISEDEKIIGMVARLVSEKAYNVFLKSAQRIIARAPKTRFLIIGDGRERTALERLCRDLGIKRHVKFLGEREDVPQLISLFDVAVLSSRIESFPVVLLEYMAGARPVVATKVGGNPEIIVNGESGFIVRPEDPEALAAAIIELLGNKKKAEKMGIEGKKRVEDKFSLNKMMQRIEDFFLDSALTGATRQARPYIIMAGPRLDVKGGISSFARYCLCSRLRDDFKIIYHPTTIDSKRTLKTFFFIKSLSLFLFRLASNRNIKIVHIYSASRGSFYRKGIILLVSKIFKRATIFHIEAGGFDLFYNSGHPLRRFCIRRILDLSDTIVVLSRSWFTEVSRMTSNRNIKIIPNAVDTTYFRDIGKKREYHRLNVLTLGRLEQRKGTYDIMDAVPLVLKKVPDARFYLAGDGDVEKVRRLCREKGIEKNVILLGWLDRTRLLEELENASIFLLPSHNEGLPVAMLEAMASGLPVISTRVGGIPELVEDGINGFLVNPGEKQELATKIVRLLEERKLRQSMGKRNIEKIDSMFSLEGVIDRLCVEYKELLQKNRSPYVKTNRLTWYMQRLSCMSIQEVIYKVYKSILLNLKRFTKKDVDLKRVLKKKTEITNFYFDSDRFQEMRQEFSNLFSCRIKDIIAEADLVCRHRFKIFNFEWNAGRDIDWHKDIVTGKTWPLRYWIDIDFRNNNDSKEARFIWELNRHQHLVTLGKAYLLTEEERYALEIKTEIFSWIKKNPPHIGINWASPLETSLRLISWCWAYKFIELSGVFSEEELSEFLKSIYMQVEFIKDNLSKYSSANNHLIGEACGLAITGLTFPEFKDSKDWIYKGKRILFEEILRQVYSDGVTKEQAFHYQGFIMELYLLTGILFIKNGIEIPDEVHSRFFTMCKFIMNIMDINGNLPHIGDSDNGRAIKLSENKSFNIFKSLLCSASILSEKGDLKEKGSEFEEEHYWLFGAKGFKKYNSIGSIKPHLDSRLFKEGGYAVFRNASHNGKEKMLVMDCGGLGYGSIAAHGHADLMSVTLSLNGIQLLIDPGSYLYHTGNAWRDYFKGTRAHNTITVNNKNQSEIKGPFMWGRRPVVKIEKWESSDRKDYISVSYRNCTIKHKRTIYFDRKEETWLIEDFLSAKGKNIVTQYFHFSPGSLVKKLDANIIEVENQGIFLYMLIDKNFSIDIKEGAESPILGWSSDIFGTKIKSPTLVNTATIVDTERFVTNLTLQSLTKV